MATATTGAGPWPGSSPSGAGLRQGAWRSAPALEPSEGEQDERYDERTDRVLDGDVSGVRLEPREKRGKATHWNEPVHGGDGKEQDAKKSSDQRQGSVHRADVREDRKFSVTIERGRHALRSGMAAREGTMRTTDGIALVAIAGGLWANVLTSSRPCENSSMLMDATTERTGRRFSRVSG